MHQISYKLTDIKTDFVNFSVVAWFYRINMISDGLWSGQQVSANFVYRIESCMSLFVRSCKSNVLSANKLDDLTNLEASASLK